MAMTIQAWQKRDIDRRTFLDELERRMHIVQEEFEGSLFYLEVAQKIIIYLQDQETATCDRTQSQAATESFVHKDAITSTLAFGRTPGERRAMLGQFLERVIGYAIGADQQVLRYEEISNPTAIYGVPDSRQRVPIG